MGGPHGPASAGATLAASFDVRYCSPCNATQFPADSYLLIP